MRNFSPVRQLVRWRGALAAGGLTLFALGVCGCANTWERISSRRFREKPFETLFTTPEPMYVLRSVPEGDDRIKAMLAVKEPKQNGGTDADQEELMQILTKAATSDPSGLCRVAAIDALGRFKDPRVGEVLVSAYHNGTVESPAPFARGPEIDGVEQAGFRRRRPVAEPHAVFAPEDVTAIQCRALESLGASRSAAGLPLLCEVAGTPVPEQPPKDPLDPLSPGGQPVNKDAVRIAAVRALGNYPAERQPVEVLIHILQTEKDVVLRSRAHESLVQMTGQQLPPRAEAWQAWLDGKQPAAPPQPGLLERIGL